MIVIIKIEEGDMHIAEINSAIYHLSQIAEELHLSGGRLYRDGIVANEQVLSKIKNGWQKPQKKSIELLCKKYNINAAWLYTGEGDMFLAGRLFYNTDFELCLSNDGQPITTGCVIPISLPMAGDFDFMCINNDKSLAPIIMPGDVIALKKLATWKTYIPGDFICVVVTSEYKVLRKVSVTQPDEQSINFTQMVDGTPEESSIPKDIIVEIYKVVGNYRRQ